NPLSPFFEGLPAVSPPPHQATAPGESLHLSFSVPVPDVRGFLPISWRMCQQGGHGFFGDLASATISVTAFLDIPADHWAVSEIAAAKAADIVRGYGDDTYHPEQPVSRDQMAVYLARAVAGGDAAVPAGPLQPTFPDVPTDHWAYRYIEFAHSKDIVRGYPEGGYGPGVALDRAQMAVFVARAIAGGEAGLESYTPPEAPTFPDAPPDSWMYAHVEYITERGVVQGYPDGLYHPDDLCTRDQMAVYVSRAFDL
ncbi:MAG: S-layer homology domain-containing protein, partial [Armatimonadetes bacterium]|nr:S-layer homology domain-containing protein [Armatimonadota bacterium]